MQVKNGTIESVSKEPHDIFLNEKTSVGSELWYLAVQSNTCVAKQAAALFVELSAGVTETSSSTSLSKRIVEALQDKESISGSLDMATMILSHSSPNTEMSRQELVQDFMLLLRHYSDDGENNIEENKRTETFSTSCSSSSSDAPSFPPPPIPKPRHLSRPKDDIDIAVKRLLDKQDRVIQRATRQYSIHVEDQHDFMTSAVVVTHPNASTVIRPGQKYRIRWRCTPQAEEAYCNEKNVEIILTRNMDQEVKKITQKFRNDGHSLKYAKQCARQLCSQICNTCRQYITVSTPLRAVKGRPEGWFDWIVPTDCPEGNYFVSLRTFFVSLSFFLSLYALTLTHTYSFVSTHSSHSIHNQVRRTSTTQRVDSDGPRKRRDLTRNSLL